MQVHKGVICLPLITFAGFAIERVESDAQRICSAGDLILSHISEFSPPPKLQHITSPHLHAKFLLKFTQPLETRLETGN